MQRQAKVDCFGRSLKPLVNSLVTHLYIFQSIKKYLHFYTNEYIFDMLND